MFSDFFAILRAIFSRIEPANYRPNPFSVCFLLLLVISSKKLPTSGLESMEHKKLSIPGAGSCYCNLSSVGIFTAGSNLLLAILAVPVSYFSSAISIFSRFKDPILDIFSKRLWKLFHKPKTVFVFVLYHLQCYCFQTGATKRVGVHSRYIFTRINRA